MDISLVITCKDRIWELERFVKSLNSQKNIDFRQVEVLFVDQGNNKQVFEILNNNIRFIYLKAEPCSLSHARNLALPHVSGKFVAFPDDDCWYEPDTLSKALDILKQEGIQGVTGKGLNERNLPTSVFPDQGAVVTSTQRCAAISYTMFFLYEPSLLFDENMGIGSPYNLGSGEETDYMLVLMEKFGYNVVYNPTLIVRHPRSEDVGNKAFLLKKHYSYARGGGYLMKKHQFPFNYYLKSFVRPILGMIGYALKGDIYKSKKSFFLLKGRAEGFFYKI